MERADSLPKATNPFFLSNFLMQQALEHRFPLLPLLPPLFLKPPKKQLSLERTRTDLIHLSDCSIVVL